MSLKNVNNNRTIIVVGREREEKMKKAMTFVSDAPLVCYANEYEIEDNFSVPIDMGIIIEEVDYKPKTDLIRKTILEYGGQVVLLSSNQKDVPKSLFNMCKLKRATKKSVDEYLSEIAPNSGDRDSYALDIFPLTRQYLINNDRDKVAQLLKLNRPPDIQMLSWLAPNIHPNAISFVDMHVKRKWSSDYFYELLAYSHDGNIHRKMQMPRRGAYSKVPKLMRRLGLKEEDVWLFNDIIKDEEVKRVFKNKLNNEHCRLLKLGEKSRRKRYEKVAVETTLDRWF